MPGYVVPGEPPRRDAGRHHADNGARRGSDPVVDVSASPGDDGPLTAHLRWWLRFSTARGSRGLYWVTDGLRGGKLSFLLAAGLFPVLIADMAASPSVRAAQSSLRICLAAYSCTVAQYFNLFSTRHLEEHFSSLINMVDHFERNGGSKEKEVLRRAAKRLRRFRTFYGTYSASLQFIMFPAFPLLEMSFPDAAAKLVSTPGTDAEAWVALSMRWLQISLLCSTSMCNNFAMHSLVLYLITAYAGFSSVWECLGLAAKAGPCTRVSLVQQANVIDAMLKVNAVIYDTLPHLLIVTNVVPLLSTVQMVSDREIELFSMGTAPLVFTFFMPLCFAGDTMAAARRGAMLRVYQGPWLEESPRQRRDRLALMLSTQGRGGLLRGFGVGYLDRSAFGKAIKSWFSFLQVLLNVL